MKKLFPFLFLLIAGHIASAQKYVYVNTDNLLLRSVPKKEYNVFDVLHAPCRLELEPYDDYENNKAVKEKYYHVKITAWFEKTKRSYAGFGWVEKKYVVTSHDKIIAPYADSTEIISFTRADVSTYDVNTLNYRLYPYPKYKGGEKRFDVESKRKYQKGKRGGCYYINAKGRKVYVDVKMCK